MFASPTPVEHSTERTVAQGHRPRFVLGALVAILVTAGLTGAPAPASAATCAPAWAAPFTDIGIDHPFCHEIRHGKVRGWSMGYPTTPSDPSPR